MFQRSRSGFTLIELLIVVAIIAILALIAVPNFLEAQMRAKIARVKSDMRAVSVAMESYFIDNDGYPKHQDYNPGVAWSAQYLWFNALTSPVAYLTSMPKDPFQAPFAAGGLTRTPWGGGWFHYDPINNNFPNPPFGIMGDGWGPWNGFVPEFRGRGFWYVLWSPGPDGDHDFAGSYAPGSRARAVSVFFDPTNGSVSSGDIIRLGPGGTDSMSL